ncbi:hypothetical protein EBB07_14670 [Paenibacillaceae bacterium]|nr:hypothetical protein EBB07_14670 [Paenibacillaceae bacterium]
MVQLNKINLSGKSINRLSELKGKFIKYLSITTAGLPDIQHNSAHNMCFLIWLDTDEGNYMIHSSLSDTDDEVSFPELVVSYGDEYLNDEGYLEDKESINDALTCAWGSAKIISIKIIRDRLDLLVKGIRHTLEIDIGLKLIFEEDELLLMSKDSSLGLMEIWFGKSQSWSNEKNNYQLVYMYDTSELVGIERIEIEV